ncbi:MAG: alpha/beta hydrolase [Candidatus Theseobacter exili]|nr:alpha/beta hydrolase [Candidatus Theseobacter exili]
MNNLDLYYEIHGDGNPLMLVAGLASDSQSWLPVIEELSRNYCVITLDNRGVGRTKPYDTDISINKIADDCIGLAKHLGFSKISLLGHSMGGFAALDCAIRYPVYISSLVLASTSAFNSQRNIELFLDWAMYLESGMNLRTWFKNVFYWLFTRRFFNDTKKLNDFLTYAVEYPFPQDVSAFKKQVLAINEFNCSSKLHAIKSKTLIVHGKEDMLFCESDTRILEKIPESSFCLIDNAAHSIHMEKPEEFTECVLEFMNKTKF